MDQIRRVDLEADLNAREDDGYCWSILSDAPNPELIVPGAIILAGEPDTPALAEVIDLVEIGENVMVRFRILPGVIDDYAEAFERNHISA